MRWTWLVVVLSPAAAARVEPVALSANPFTGGKGASFTVAIRGTGIKGATAIHTGTAALQASIVGAESEDGSKGKTDVVRVRFESAADARAGRYAIRLIAPGGISNALPIVIAEEPVVHEPAGSHDTPETAVVIGGVPVVFNAHITKRGESDFFAIDAKAGQQFTFTAVSGLPAPGSAGGNARGFDPSLAIYEASGSWFDPKRINRIAANDEPLWVLGLPTDARLVHRFAKAGRYLLRVEAFSGQGGPDYSYQLKIREGDAKDPVDIEAAWRERSYSRYLSANRLNELAERGGKALEHEPMETYGMGDGSEPRIKIPANLDGAIARPGEFHRARFQLDASRDIAIEISTPNTAPPEFNPIVRLLDDKGEEVATNVSVGRGACTGAMTKSLQSKAIVPLRNPGEYTVEVREATADLAGANFRYRVQVRQQVPHAGDVVIDADHITLTPGESKTMRVTFDREEDYRGAVAVLTGQLPPGVQAVASADFEPDKDPPPTKGKRERFSPRTERSVVAFIASADAAATPEPAMVQVTVHPVADGKIGAALAVRAIPLMVVPKQ